MNSIGQSIWNAGVAAPDPHAPLDHDVQADVVVVGAGITGLTTALQLAEAGQRVVVVEALAVGQGTTGGSTGNLYSTLARGLGPLRAKWGEGVARDVVTARAEAVDRVEQTAQRLGIDCGFQRCSLYRLLESDDERLTRALDDEWDALLSAGLTVAPADTAPLPMSIRRGLSLPNQAQFDPVRYVRGLAGALRAAGGALYEHTPALEVDADQGVVITPRARVTAASIVLATHTPKGVDLLQTGMLPSREYGITATLGGQGYPDGIFWLLDPFHSIRSCHHNGNDYLVLVGEQHKTGEGELGSGYYDRLCSYARIHFDVLRFEHRWSAQQYSSADGLPYIGRRVGADNVYVATGFAADGLTWGVLAGSLIADRITGVENPWAERFDARRFTPAKSMKEWLKENASVAKHFAKDYLMPGHGNDPELVKPGEGRVISSDGQRLAVYRSVSGELTQLSAVCPHMKCLVHWNDADTTWDCPCHGSRFDTDGSVIEGPAYQGLTPRNG